MTWRCPHLDWLQMPETALYTDSVASAYSPSSNSSGIGMSSRRSPPLSRACGVARRPLVESRFPGLAFKASVGVPTALRPACVFLT